MDAIRLAIHGAGGRMGQRLVTLASEDPELTVVAGFEAAELPTAGPRCGPDRRARLNRRTF